MTTSRVDPELSSETSENKLANHAYVSGIIGAIALLGLGYLGAVANVLDKGWTLFSARFTATPYQSAMFVLVVCVVAMLVPELLIRFFIERELFHVAEKLKRGELSKFLVECIINFLLDVLALYIAITFYRYTSEYGYHRNGEYYRSWFDIVDLIWRFYLIMGLPYTLITRAVQYDPRTDRRMTAYLLLKTLIWLVPRLEKVSLISNSNLFGMNDDRYFHEFTSLDATTVRGVLVKLFFMPIMTVFFMMHFRNLLNDWNYVNANIGRTPFLEFMSVKDFYNVSFTFLMSIDTALAWCGYAVSTRWVKNTNVSVEPTLLGWTVALLSYPPFQQTYGYYFSALDERGFFALPSDTLVGVCAVMSIMCYAIYVSATIMFGLRFSNLTDRGIFTKGPYRFVRHPAYIAKNVAWWVSIIPQIAYHMYQGSTSTILTEIVGLTGLTILYYFRAMTEERHLEKDPEYRDYQKRVPYRFIPGVI